jgi:hypothetical protein
MDQRKSHKISPLRISLLLSVFCTLAVIAIAGSMSSGDGGGREAFIKGRQDLDAGRYSDAVTDLLIAQKEFSILEDYALFYLADSYRNLEDHGKAKETLRTLIDRFPASPLRKKARMAEIREAKDIGSPALVLYEAYVKDFPEDD